jgi:hypothetical protein
LGVNWAFTLQLWMIAQGPALAFSFAAVDGATALAMYRMAERRWFPAPLVFVHGFLAVYHLYTAFIGPDKYWVVVALNRVFDVEIIYVAGCGLYRIAVLNRRRAG